MSNTTNSLWLGPTVYGIEHEYSVTATYGDAHLTEEIVGQCHSKDSDLGLFFEPRGTSLDGVNNDTYNAALKTIDMHRNGHGMLSNGGRFYIDPSGPEYCTPETTTASEAVLRTFDGDRVMFGILRYLQTNGFINTFQLNRRIIDHRRSSRGVHINAASIHGNEPGEQLIESIIALNVAKGAMFGSGGLLVDEEGNTEFHHSPRLSLTDHDGKTGASYTDRPLVRHPFKADIGCSRIETITSDALSFAWPLRASMVMTNALIKLTELDEFKGKLPRIHDPITAAQIVGQLGNVEPIEVIDRFNVKYVYPSEILRRIAELAILADDKYDQLDEESRQVLPEVLETADLIRTDPTKVIQRVESLARFEFMKRKMEEAGVGLGSVKMCQYDYYWDKIGGGVAERLREIKGWGWHGFDDADTKPRSKTKIAKPPKDTRAALRGRLIHESQGKNNSDWYDIEVDNDTHESELVYPLMTKLAE